MPPLSRTTCSGESARDSSEPSCMEGRRTELRPSGGSTERAGVLSEEEKVDGAEEGEAELIKAEVGDDDGEKATAAPLVLVVLVVVAEAVVVAATEVEVVVAGIADSRDGTSR